MQRFDELDLLDLPMGDAGFARDPFPRFAAARNRHPWLARWDLGPIVTSYQAVRDLMAMEDRMRMPYDELVTFMGAEGTPWGRFQEGHILSMNGERHKRIRDLLAPAFTPRQANLHRPLMREVIDKVLDEWAPKGAFDFEEFASDFPVTVMFRLIGADPADLPSIRTHLETMGLSVSMDPTILDQLQGAVVGMDEFVQDLMARRRREGPQQTDNPDLLDILLNGLEGGTLTERELADLLLMLFVAGFDTSKNVMTLMMYELLKRPDYYERCAGDFDFCKRVLEETMRVHSVTTTNRTLTADIVYRDVLLPRGTSVWFPWSVIARDPESTANADSFDPDRPDNTPHMGFALGAHMCLGQYIARAQIQEGLHAIAKRITNPRSPGPLGWRPFPGVWGIAGLPIEFDPAPAA